MLRTERQNARMPEIKNGGLDQYGKEYSFNGIGDERINNTDKVRVRFCS